MGEKRDLSIDLMKGMAIILVYMSHSVLYYPPHLFDHCEWSKYLMSTIISCNMPLFFFISGILSGFSKKSNIDIIKGKAYRLLIPWLFAMAIIVIAKLILPASVSAYPIKGFKEFMYYLFVMGGDRWFIYVMVWMVILTLPLRKIATTIWIMPVVAVLFFITITGILGDYYALNRLIWYMPFFLIGMFLNQYYKKIRQISNSWYMFFGVAIIFLIMNVIFVIDLNEFKIMKYFLLPVTGIAFFMFLSFLIDDVCKKRNTQWGIVRYIAYCGKYSLQFYLFTFAYPIIRYFVVNVIHMVNPLAIFMTVLALQLIVMTIIVELTKNVKFLKTLMGY